MNVYDSAGRYTTSQNKEEIAALLHTSQDTITIRYMNVQYQFGASDYVLAFATSLCLAIDPTSVVTLMRSQCLELEREQLEHRLNAHEDRLSIK